MASIWAEDATPPPPGALSKSASLSQLNAPLSRSASSPQLFSRPPQEPEKASPLSPCTAPPCVRRKRAKSKHKLRYNTVVTPVVQEKVTKTFLQAYPTRSLSIMAVQKLLPLDWSPDCVRNFHRCGLIRVPLHVLSVLHIINNLNMQLGECIIKDVEKVENPYLFLQYQLKMIENEGSYECELYHSTSYEKALSIIKNNFNWRLAGSRVGHRHGLGVYFTASAPFCLKFARQGGNRGFLIARVLVRAISKGTADTRLPEPSTDATGDGRHTIVKYHDHEFYPQYIVHF